MALVLGGVVVFARNYVQQDSLLITNTLAATVALLHGEMVYFTLVGILEYCLCVCGVAMKKLLFLQPTLTSFISVRM